MYNKKLNQYQLGCVFDITKKSTLFKKSEKKIYTMQKNHKCYEKW